MELRHHPGHRRRHRAGVRLHQRLPRHRQRGRDVDLDEGDVAARGRRARGDPELRRRVHLARGRRDGGQGHRRGRRRSRRRSCSRASSARSPGTSSTWYFGLPSSSSHALIGGVAGAAFVAAGPDAVLGDGLLEKVIIPALVAPLVAFVAAGMAILFSLPARRPAAARARSTAASASARSARAASSRSRTARTTRRRRWASSRSRSSPTATSAPTTSRSRSGSSSRRRPRSRSARTRAAGGSSARWAAGSSRWTRRRASAPRARAPTVILVASHLGYPLSTTHTISGSVMGAGAARRLSAVRWGVAGNMAIAWVLTIPALGRDRRASPTA